MLTALTCRSVRASPDGQGCGSGSNKYLERSMLRRTELFGDFPCSYGPTVDSEDCSEPWTAELSDDIQDTSIVGGLTDQPAQIRCMKLPVGAWCRADLIMKLLHFGIFFPRLLRPCRGPRN